MDFMESYGVVKGVRAYKVEDGVLGSLGLPGDREESASHQFMKIMVPKKMLCPRASSTLSVATDTPLSTKLCSYK